MVSYIIKRLLMMIPILFILSLGIFLLIHLTPGSPSSTILGMEATSEEIAELDKKLGLNRPLHEQYIDWVVKVLKGDLGESIFMKESVSVAIKNRLLPTFSLAIYAEIISILTAVPLGMYCGKDSQSLLSNILGGISILGFSLPSFVLSIFLMLIFALKLKWFPVAGFTPPDKNFLEFIKSLTLPALSLGLLEGSYLFRIVKKETEYALSQGYVDTAITKGERSSVILHKEVGKNLLLPSLSVIGQSFSTLLTGAIVVETVFAIPGLGQLLINSIKRKDLVLIQGITLFMSLVYLFINLILDLLFILIDPRIIEEGRK